MFTDKELDELDARFKSAMEDKFDAYNEELNARQKEIERLGELVDAEQGLAKGIKERNAYLEQEVGRLREQVVNLQTRNNALYEAMALDILKGKLK